MNGLVSGANSNGGNVNAEVRSSLKILSCKNRNLIFTSSQVEGKGSIDGSGHNLSGGMNGAVNGTGNSQLVGAQNLQSNRTGTNTSQLIEISLLFGPCNNCSECEGVGNVNSRESASHSLC